MNQNKYQEIYNKILEYQTIIIHRHTKPDGDAIGSQIGLKEAISSTFPSKSVKVVGDMQERYSWMGEMDVIDDDIYNKALVIVVDTGTERLISDERYTRGNYLIKIDHHLSQGEYGNLALVDTTYESCAGLISDLIFSLGLKLTSYGASVLFTGIVTDSGRFRFSSTSSNTFRIVSKLLEYEINTENIYNQLYTEKLPTIKLKAELTMKFQITPNGVAYLINTQNDYQKYVKDNPHLTVNDLSRGMIGIMGGIENVPIWVNFTEEINGDIYVEIRSNGININQVATLHGGGGHLQASGCTIHSYEEVSQIIKELDQLIEESK